MSASPDLLIDHALDCGTSRNPLAKIRDAGVEPHFTLGKVALNRTITVVAVAPRGAAA